MFFVRRFQFSIKCFGDVCGNTSPWPNQIIDQEANHLESVEDDDIRTWYLTSK